MNVQYLYTNFKVYRKEKRRSLCMNVLGLFSEGLFYSIFKQSL